MAAKIKKGDTVAVINGDHRGETGKVLRVVPKLNVVFVEGVNLVYRHLRQSRQNPQGGRIRKEAPIHISKVLPVDPKTGKPSRVRFQMDKDGSKQRVTRGGTVLSDVSAKKAK